jgi:hypothetical protein
MFNNLDRLSTAATALIVVDLAQLGPLRSLGDLLGRPVVNEDGGEVGVLDDLLSDGARLSHAVLSVGGFLGLGAHRVVVDLAQLAIDGDTVMLAGATVESLSGLTQYGSAAGARLTGRQGHHGVKDAGEIVTGALGEPVVGLIADISDGDR